jgi:hypothetical protein
MLYFFDGCRWICFPIIRIGSEIAEDSGSLIWVRYLIPDTLENRELYDQDLPSEWGAWFDPKTEIFCPD